MYHKGPDVEKSGPKGAWKVKDEVLGAINEELERDYTQTSFAISDKVFEKTGVRVSDRHIRRIRHLRGKSGLVIQIPTVRHHPSQVARR